MKAEFQNYLKDIGLSTVMADTINKKYLILTQAANVKDFDDIIVSEIISKQGNREYFSLWGFTPTLFCKISIIATADVHDIVLFKLKNNIARFSFSNLNYDLINETPQSTLDTLVRTFDMEVPYSIKSSGINCSHLLSVTRKYFISNINT